MPIQLQVNRINLNTVITVCEMYSLWKKDTDDFATLKQQTTNSLTLANFPGA